MALTTRICETAICPPGKKRHRIHDEGGLYVEISPTGAKRWLWKFVRNGKEGRLALGAFPAVSVDDARRACNKAKDLAAEGINPVAARKAARLANAEAGAHTFETVARKAIELNAPNWSPRHAARALSMLERDAFSDLGKIPVAMVTAPMLLTVLRKVEQREALEQAAKLRGFFSTVFRYAIGAGLVTANPARDINDAMAPAPPTVHRPTILNLSRLQYLLQEIHAMRSQSTRTALLLCLITLQRPGNVRRMRWTDVPGLRSFMPTVHTWTVPAAEMKRTVQGKRDGPPHLVPLPRQAVALLKAMPQTSEWVFEGNKGGRPISDMTLSKALKDAGFPDQTPHGFRATGRTLLVERFGQPADVIERQLAHVAGDATTRAYDRAQHIDARRLVMQRWADWLDRLRDPGLEPVSPERIPFG